MKKTPFDKIAVDLLENPLKATSVPMSPDGFSRTQGLLWAFIGILQIKYLHMYEASEACWGLNKTQEFAGWNKGTVNFSEEMIKANQKTLQAKISYFSFLEELNRYGRLFERKYQKVLPDYYRIKFFRNKMVEHWDDYVQFRSHMEALKPTPNKLVVPYHAGLWGGSITEIPILRKAFKKYGISLAIHLESPLDPYYSESIFTALETIDRKLGRKIPKDLEEAIFRCGFPTPIHDLENYFDRLISWIRS